jgi:NADPH:quinone reductase-like Zn-dependent oxidoreductase
MFNSPPDDQRKAGLEMVRWIEEGLLKSIVGREFPLLSAVDAVKFLEAKTIHGVGTLNGKVVITIE